MDKSLFRPLKPVSLKEEFVYHMEDLIFQGKLKAGEKLPPERELAKEFGISRPIIHEGILILENRGLVTLRPRHGVIINDYRKEATLDLLLSLINNSDHKLSPDLAKDLENFRIYMEKGIVTRICENEKCDSDIKGLKYLKDINKQMHQAEQPELLAELDFQFHLGLGLMSSNTLFALLVNTLKPAHMDLLTRFYALEEIRNQVVEYHDKLIKSLSDKDLETALIMIEKTDSYSTYLK
jgi:GntR family transcriptional regulator, transcriptional repressor for pyruvate dehydrogenase complex